MMSKNKSRCDNSSPKSKKFKVVVNCNWFYNISQKNFLKTSLKI